MKRLQALTSTVAGAFAVATMFGASAFAENRHRDATPDEQRVQGAQFESVDRTGGKADEKRAWGSDDARDYRNRGQQPDRAKGQPRQYSIRESTAQHERPRASVGNGGHGERPRGGYGNNEQSERFVTQQGRISRIEKDRSNDGYRVWLDGGRYPYFVPAAHYHNYGFRVGASIHFGGYWSPLGYWTVYDIGGYPGYAPVYTSRYVHGTVVRVDYRRGLLTLDDDLSGRWITVELGGNSDMRYLDRGDRVEFKGAWAGRGVFRAYRLTYLDDDDDWNDRGYHR